MKSASYMLAVVALGFACVSPTFADDQNETPKVTASEMNLIGKWDIDAKAFFESLKQGNGDGEVFEPLFKDLKMQLQFRAEGKMSVDMKFSDQEEKKTGTWKVVKLEADTAIISSEMDGEKKDEIRIKFIDRDTIDLYPPKEEAENSPFEKMRFTREKVKGGRNQRPSIR